MKSRSKIVSISLLLIMVLIVGYLFGLQSQPENNAFAQEEDVSENTINVSGEGTIQIKPNIAYIEIGVETEDENSHQAQMENSKKMNNIMKELKKVNIKDDDIKTVQYNIMTLRRYDKEKQENIITGYKVMNVAKVTIKDIDDVGKIIDSVSKAGSNYIRSISFGTDKQEEYYLQALKVAMNNAESKAKALAGSFEATINKPYKVYENSSMKYSAMDDNRYAYSGLEKSVSYDTPVIAGDLEIKATVSVIYKYE